MRKNTTIELGITYVGIDAHKKEHRIYILYPGEELGKETKIKNHPQEIKRMVKKIKKNSSGPVRMCYEAGACGFALQRQIEACGAKCVVIAPSKTPVKKGERVKTDRRDAKKLAELDRAKLLTEVAPPNLEEEGIRDFCRMREAAKHDQTRARHQLDKFLVRLGYTYKEGRNWTKKHLVWIKGLKMETKFLQEVFNDHVMHMEYCTQRVARLDRRLEEMAQEEAYKQEVGWLRCFHL
jgi:transposase